MKAAKKIISVILAVIMALGVFSVAVSARLANGGGNLGTKETSTYQGSFKLTAKITHLDGTTDNKEYTYLDEIEVQPGDRVEVYMYTWSNYEIGVFMSEVFYSAPLLDAAEAGYITSTSTVQLRKAYVWNTTDNEFVADYTSASSRLVNCWTGFTVANQTGAKYWPIDFTVDTDKWHYTRINANPDPGLVETTVCHDDSTYLMHFPLKVPEDATAGTKYQILVPEGLIRSREWTSGMVEMGHAPDGDFISSDPVMYYNEDQYIDVTQASLNLTVASAQEEADADYSAVEAAKASVPADIDSGKYEAAAVQAVKDAVAAVEYGKKESEQTVVDGYAKAINDAVTALLASVIPADYTALDALITEVKAIDRSIYTDESLAALDTALTAAEAVDRNLDTTQQSVVTEAYNNLLAAKNGLAPLGADTSALKSAIAEANAIDGSLYTEVSYKALTDAVAVGQALVDNEANLTIADQTEIDAATAAITAAKNALDELDADYSAVNEAKAKIPTDLSNYTDETVAAVNAAVDAVVEGLKKSKQPQVDAYAAAINDAVSKLQLKAANLTELKAAITDANTVDASLYTEDSYAALTEAVAAGQALVDNAANLTIKDQTAIDEATAAITTAKGKLVPLGADTTALEAAIKKYETMYASGNYVTDDAAWENCKNCYDLAVAAKNAGYSVADQFIVDAAKDDLLNALSRATPAGADYSGVEAAIERIPSDEDLAAYYKADAVQAVQDAVDDVVYGLAKSEQTTVDGYAAAINAAVDALDDNLLPVDTTALEAAIAKADAVDKSLYTDETVAALEEAYANAQHYMTSADSMTKRDDQAAYDTCAAALNAAVDALDEKPAYYTALNAAKTEFEALDSTKYTSASWANAKAAYDAACAVAADLPLSQQSVVSYAADTLTAAINALAEKADYTALDAAIAEAKTYDANLYTAESYAALAAAVKAAEELSRDLPADQQSVIDAAAAAIKTAIDGLAEKTTPSTVTEFEYTPSVSTVNTFSFKVSADANTLRVAKLQIIEENGGTRTYDRYHKAVSIKSYDANGNEVNDLSRSKAYEIWTLSNINLPSNINYSVIAIYQDYTRETYEDGFKFTVSLKCDDADVYEVKLESDEGTSRYTPATVTTGLDVTGIRFVRQDGATQTYYADTYATEVDGKLIYSVPKLWASESGRNTYTVMARIAGTWTEVSSATYNWIAE